MRVICLILLSFLLLEVSYAQEMDYELSSKMSKSFSNGTLKKFELEVFDSTFTMEDYISKSTSIVSSFETKNVEDLKDYAIVQYIKGCVFDESTDSTGNVVRVYQSREFFNQQAVTFKHPEWVIDSVDTDPIYSSLQKRNSRLGGYFWTEEEGNVLFDDVKEFYYFNQLPTIPKLSIRDLPTGGSSSESYGIKSTTNSSLDFKICIYNIKDIPLVSKPNEIDFATPIHCFEWRSSKIYNKKSKKLESIEGIHPFCKK